MANRFGTDVDIKTDARLALMVLVLVVLHAALIMAIHHIWAIAGE